MRNVATYTKYWFIGWLILLASEKTQYRVMSLIYNIINGIIPILLSSKAQGCKAFWKASKPFYVGIHWIVLAEHSQMSTHVPGSFFRFFAPFSVGQISQQQHKGLCSLFPMILKRQCVLKCFGVQLQSKKGNLILQVGSLKSIYIWNLHSVWSYTHGNILITIHTFANLIYIFSC